MLFTASECRQYPCLIFEDNFDTLDFNTWQHNGRFLDPTAKIPNPGGVDMEVPDVSWISVAENNDPSLGSAPVTLHVIKVDRTKRYRGSIKVVLSENVFDESFKKSLALMPK